MPIFSIIHFFISIKEVPAYLLHVPSQDVFYCRSSLVMHRKNPLILV